MLGNTPKSSNACGHFKGDGLDGPILGFKRIGIEEMCYDSLFLPVLLVMLLISPSTSFTPFLSIWIFSQ